MDAHGTLDSLLGRLGTILIEEAQLLGGVRGDVEFIKEEMECMKSLILHITDAQHRDHLVQSWTKQVVGLARDCEGNVEHYIHYVGSRPRNDGSLPDLFISVLWFLRTIRVRHRLATRIRELKVHARDIGDRRQRYGITMPPTPPAGMNDVDGEPARAEEDLRRRAVLLQGTEPPADDGVVVTKAKQSLIKFLSMVEATTEGGAPLPRVRVFSILGYGLADDVANSAYCYEQHPSLATLFNCKAWCVGGDVIKVLIEILQQVDEVTDQTMEEIHDQMLELHPDQAEMQLLNEIQGHLFGKRFMIVVTTHNLVQSEWKHILDALLRIVHGSLPGSAIVMTTQYKELAMSSSPYKIINATNLVDFYTSKAQELTADRFREIIWRLANKCSLFARKMFVHLLYANPTNISMFDQAVSHCLGMNRSVDQTMVRLCYNELPTKYRSCLLYLTIFTQGHIIKTTGLARRWIAEGLVTKTSGEIESAEEKAGHYLDVLFIRGFISPVEVCAAGNIKSFTLKEEVHKVIAKIAREVNIVDTNMPTELAGHFSIQNRIGMDIYLPNSYGARKDIASYLRYLAESPQWCLLKVLDLEGCNGLGPQHLKRICKILLLKYLSLRNTDVAELPKQIKELQCLETLDIRQTKVRMFAKTSIVLKLLKHLLAGSKVSGINDSTMSEDSTPALHMPLCIEKMNNIEVLSHVRVSNSNELARIAQLLKLRKLGVALQGRDARLSDLLLQIENLNECLRSLSIRVDPHLVNERSVDPLPTIPEFIERLNISGITGGLRQLIQAHLKLTKITLCDTHLEEADLAILGQLGALHCLRLQHGSYTESEIEFRREEFRSLKYLLVEVNDITKIRFASAAAPKIERIVWSFARMDALSGLNHLSKLKNLELNGDCDLHPIEEELLCHPNEPTVKHNQQLQGQEGRTAAPTSSLSAP